MRRSVLSLAIVGVLSGPVFAQVADPTKPQPVDNAAVPLTYVASNGWVGLGVNDDGDVHGEARGFFGDNGERLWSVEGWLGQAGAGGVGVGYHWLWGGKTRQDTIDNPDSVTVAKAFVAVDQNAFDDRKLAVGVGMEREHWFGSLYLQGGLTGQRFLDSSTVTTTNLLTGTDNGRPYQQTETINTLTEVFEKPYDEGVGARIGRFFEPGLVRVQGGLDYERGDFDSDQTTVSFGVEKFFNDSRHSLALDAEFLDKNGQFEVDRSDTRAMLTWRYELGKRHNFRPAEPFTQEEVKRTVEKQIPVDPIIVKNEIQMNTDAFFELDRSVLTAAGEGALQSLLTAMTSDRRVGGITIVGHTCDLGPDAYNQALSERRAKSVQAYLEGHGVPGADLTATGAGESSPKYPNTPAERHQNRRVEVSFLTVEEKLEEQPPKTVSEDIVEWKKTPVKMPAAWIERALRNPSEHKRTVDVYRIEEVSENRTLGPRVFLNRGPAAANDTNTTSRGTASNISVLANDTDPDGDALTITTVGNPANGTAVISGSSIRYTPNANFVGTDTFSYTISDGRNGTATATVTVTVLDNPPVAVNDSANTPFNTPVSLNVLTNDSDPQNDPLSVVSTTTPANGAVTFSASGNVTYTPNSGFSGVDSFNYTIRDSNGSTAQATVSITVSALPANRAPVALDDSAIALGMVFVPLEVLLNDSDPDGDSLTVLSFTQPANGSVIQSSVPGVLHYRANPGFCGLDTFTYTISDGRGGTATATVTVDVLD
ncbi:Ig-like domain-containing protein [Ahniella affigens]|nr:Ig-like domain-containing protein [Ahniella affigens]